MRDSVRDCSPTGVPPEAVAGIYDGAVAKTFRCLAYAEAPERMAGLLVPEEQLGGCGCKRS